MPAPTAVHIIGAGLAGSEAAWQLVRRGVPVILHEMRPYRRSEAHQSGDFAELVCSNSLRADDPEANAVGLLHAEMRACESLILATADAHKVPAGGALAVDREPFAAAVTAALAQHPLVTVRREDITALPPTEWGEVIIASGPLTTPELAAAIAGASGADTLAFFDAIAPIVYADSINLEVAWFQSRYDKSGPGGSGRDYLNCPLSRDGYYAFVAALLEAPKVEFHEWETNTPYFEGCLPIEIMAGRGPDTLRFGPMKPVGLTDPRTGRWPFAVVQLRPDNALGTLFNLVGFQTKMKHAAQLQVFRMIPGLEQAEFARLGGLHRNSFLNGPKVFDPWLRLKTMPHLRFAGQITGCEGYVESAAVGLLAGRFAAAERLGHPLSAPPPTTALGALLAHITGGGNAETYQPMNINFGLFPPLAESVRKNERKRAYSQRALADLAQWLGDVSRTTC